jgi:hypothetical protein
MIGGITMYKRMGLKCLLLQIILYFVYIFLKINRLVDVENEVVYVLYVVFMLVNCAVLSLHISLKGEIYTRNNYPKLYERYKAEWGYKATGSIIRYIIRDKNKLKKSIMEDRGIKAMLEDIKLSKVMLLLYLFCSISLKVMPI